MELQAWMRLNSNLSLKGSTPFVWTTGDITADVLRTSGITGSRTTAVKQR
jgi:hypothetical protein